MCQVLLAVLRRFRSFRYQVKSQV